jgi:hypothetical protein
LVRELARRLYRQIGVCVYFCVVLCPSKRHLAICFNRRRAVKGGDHATTVLYVGFYQVGQECLTVRIKRVERFV